MSAHETVPTVPLAVTHATATSALGIGRAAHAAALRDGATGLRPEPWETMTLATWIGRVDAVEHAAVPAHLAAWECRNNRLAHLALEADDFGAAVTKAAKRWGAHRVGVFVGTSTSGILQTELAYRARAAAGGGALPAWFDYARTHNTGSVAAFVREALRLQGPAFVVSTACSSGAKVFANAQRAIDAGLIDAAVVGGVDSLCLTTLYGFNSLELLSSDIARPYDARRNGLSIGEAAAFALVERDVDAPVWLRGWGESSDGHHMSAPHPDGQGAATAMRDALARAGAHPRDVDYVNLHGTATPSNDAAEDLAMTAVFGAGGVACSSTKGATGHTLGAAGALEALLAMLALEAQRVPGGINRREPDPALHAAYVDHGSGHARDAPLRLAMTNSFGFGGSNASLVFGLDRG
jgi:3-oxoacyl-[acyl-carrier-protein] synthase-1